MSALPPKADMAVQLGMSGLGQERTLRPLFDHLISTAEQRLRDGNAEPLGGLEVDDKLVFGRRLHRQVSRLLALEDAINVLSCSAVGVNRIRAIGHQAAACGEDTKEINRGQTVPG